MASMVRIVTSLFAISFFFLATFPELEASIGGLTIDLIHRDSPHSPLYDASAIPTERYSKAVRRGISRLHRHEKNSGPGETTVSADSGEYLMKFSIGNPPVDIYGIVDTGSDLTWIQCQPCISCYKQLNPIFNPKSSSTYSDVNCPSQECKLLDTVSCSPQNLCSFTYGYASGTLIQGNLAKETITISSQGGKPFTFNNIVFGCGRNNTGAFFNEHQMGIVGLGGRPLSLSSQLGASLGSTKFSYCLVPFGTDPSTTSKMYFGPGSEVTGQGAKTVSLIPKEDKTYYYVTVAGISIGGKLLPYNANGTVSSGHMLIDSGTPPTLLPKDFYNRLESEVKNAIMMTPYVDPNRPTELCYRSATIIEAPILTIHFDGGAQIPLVPASTFVSPEDNVFCFGMHPVDSDVGIIGNFAQSNYRVGFDLGSQTFSFRQTDCTKE